jgi:hypothetical protein
MGVAMDEIVEDDFVYPAIIRLVACLDQAIKNRNLPEPCTVAPMIGELVLDFCGECSERGCGQAWVRIVDSFPSVDFPQIDQSTGNCGTLWAATLEIGIVRCKPLGRSSGLAGYSPPTLNQMVEALRVQTADMRAMREAVQCCFVGSDTPYYMTAYQPGAPDGDCLGGVFNVVIGQE